jgi:hypothetical protein
LRRRATRIATVLDTITRLTDDTVVLFDRAVGRMFRRAEVREQDALMRDARAINDKVRLLAKLGAALIEARESGADLQAAVASVIGWDKLARSVVRLRLMSTSSVLSLLVVLSSTSGWQQPTSRQRAACCPMSCSTRAC